jgi:hypothetical protein
MSEGSERQYEQPALDHERGGTFEKDVPRCAKQEKITGVEASMRARKKCQGLFHLLVLSPPLLALATIATRLNGRRISARMVAKDLVVRLSL